MPTELAVAEVHEERAISIIEVISRAAANPAVDPDKMMKLLEMQERFEAKQAQKAFNEALTRLSVKMPRIKRDGSVEYEKNGVKSQAFRFATYENIDRFIRPLLHEEGFSLSFESATREGGGIIVTGKLNHVGGHFQTASIPIALDNSGGKNNIQGMGSSFSYGKRYTATMLLNIVTEGEDNDGKTPAEFIDEKQVQQIYDLFTACNMTTPESRKRFFELAGVTSVEKIQAHQYEALVNRLLAKERQIRGAK